MSEETEPRPRRTGSWRGLASSALLVGAVGAILLTGWALRGARTPPTAQGAPVPATQVALGSPVALEPPPVAPPWPTDASDDAAAEPAAAPVVPDEPIPLDPALDRLARRAADDLSRLARAPGPWSAQILVACRPETVERLLGTAGGGGKLYVVPAEVRGASCFRVLWGSYASAKDAAAAADLPSALRGKDKPGAVEIAKVLP